MSQRDGHGYDIEQRTKARRTMAQAVSEYADSHEVTEGGICTGYVVVMEIATARGHSCFWVTGNGGSPDDDHTEGLDSWRVEGLVRQVLRDIYERNVSDE